jgi:hypothetical protein
LSFGELLGDRRAFLCADAIEDVQGRQPHDGGGLQ